MLKKYIIVTILLCLSPLSSQIVLSEVMFDPEGSDNPNEFVELYNLSEVDTINLTGWKIRDIREIDSLIDAGSGMKLPPHSFGLIFEGDYDFDTGLYNSIFPDSAIALTIDGKTLGNQLSQTDSLYLIDPDGMKVDSVGWENISNPGFSMERIRLYMPSEESNWSTSLDSLGTPGFLNSVTPLEVDGLIVSESIHHSPTYPSPGQEISLSIPIFNKGLTSIGGEVFVYWQNEILATSTFTDLEELATTIISFQLPSLTHGIQSLFISLYVDGDMNIEDNTTDYEITVQFELGIVQINEFLYLPDGEQVEFIEFRNVSNDSVNLHEWSFSDATTSTYVLPEITVPSHTYFIVAEDTSIATFMPENSLLILSPDGFSTLNNSGDEIYIYDPTGLTIDSLTYTPDWGSQIGHSLEKITPELPSDNPDNWSVCQDSLGITPGRKNSISPLDIDAAINANTIIHSPIFPTSDQTITLSVTVLNMGTSTVDGTVDVSENELLLSNTSFTELTADDSILVEVELSPLSPGIHILDIYVTVNSDMNPNNNITKHTLVVQYLERVITLNEFLYSPDPGFEEFIEFVNISEDSLDLHMWGFSDSDTSSIRKFPPFKIASQEYVVVSKDSSILPFIPEDGVLLVSENGFPSLNNTEDSIFLFDPTGYIIDSLHYSSSWGGNNSRSLEKFNPGLESSNQSNWGACVSSEKMTPGQQNSNFFESLPSQGKISLDPNPFSPDGDGFEDELRISYNLPFSQSYLTVTIFDNIGRTARDLVKNLVSSSQGILVWDGYTNKGKRARIGIYIIKINAVDMNTQKSVEWIDTIVLAEPLR